MNSKPKDSKNRESALDEELLARMSKTFKIFALLLRQAKRIKESGKDAENCCDLNSK
jgi:hypothetical protein